MEFGGRGPLLVDRIRMFRIPIASLPRVFICSDVLDELLPKGLPEFVHWAKGDCSGVQ